jgi:hypothetical protein
MPSTAPYVSTGYDSDYGDGDHAFTKDSPHACFHEIDGGRTGYGDCRGEFRTH